MAIEPKYPDFCTECYKVSSCKQKVYMLADTQPVEGYYYDAGVYCKDCLEGAPQDKMESYSGESDYPIHCMECGIPIECQLTDDGVEYVREATSEGAAGCCRELWPELFRDYLIS